MSALYKLMILPLHANVSIFELEMDETESLGYSLLTKE